jgi:hypothetical protein
MRRIYSILLFSFLLIEVASPAYARDVAFVCLLDMSGSLSGATNCDVLAKNINELRKMVEGLNKNERMVVLGFGWKGKPALIVDETMPSKGGGGGKLLMQKKDAILKSISSFLRNVKRELDDTATDIVGSIKYAALIRLDLKNTYDVKFSIFSDGLQTWHLNVPHLKNKATIDDYILSLQRYLQGNKTDLSGISLEWFGDYCPMKNMSHDDYAKLQAMLKSSWVEYLKGNGAKSVDYYVIYK